LNQSKPPANISQLLEALWYDGKGGWEKSHNIAQDIHTNDGSWIHAYLHRKEGDLGNASYWYHRADKPVCKVSLQEEWEQIVRNFLTQT
jgi:hypothetical protein